MSFYMILKKSRFQMLLIYSTVCISTHFMVSIYFKNANVGTGGVVLFQNQLLTRASLLFEWGKVLFKSGVAFARIRYAIREESKFTSLF